MLSLYSRDVGFFGGAGLNAEKQMEIVEETESDLYMTVRILYEDSFYGHQGYDLYDPDKVTFQEERVKKQDTLGDFLELLAVQTGFGTEKLRIWPLYHRTNQTLRPTLLDMEADLNKPMFEVAESFNPWTVFLEISKRENSALPTFDKDGDLMLFFKYYEPEKEKVNYMGHMYVGITTKLSDIVPDLVKQANLPAGTTLAIYEEIKPNMLEKVKDLDNPLEHVREELMDGDIFVFEKEKTDANYRLPTCREFFRDLFLCGPQDFGNPVKLEATDGMTFFLVGRKQYDTLRFWIYIVGSYLEAKHYSYTLTVVNNAGNKKYIHQGEVFSLDLDEVATGSVFMMATEAAQKICEEDTNLNVNVSICNLKEEAKDDDMESGVDDGED